MNRRTKRDHDNNESSESSESSDNEENTVIKENAENDTNMSYSGMIIKSAKTGICIVYDATKIYLLWTILHYLAAHYYVPICSPYGIWGFIITPILAVTPQCKALRWVITTSGNTMETMWIVIGLWVCSQVPSTINSASNSIMNAINTNDHNSQSIQSNKQKSESNKQQPKYNIRSRSRSYDNIHD
jgi:hypothetical protein